MLIDTRVPPPGPDRAHPEDPLLDFLDWLLPWPALIAWLVVAASMVEGWPGVALAMAALAVSCWRVSRWFLPVGGLRDHRQ